MNLLKGRYQCDYVLSLPPGKAGQSKDCAYRLIVIDRLSWWLTDKDGCVTLKVKLTVAKG